MSYHGIGFMDWAKVGASIYEGAVKAGKMPAGLSPEYLKSYPAGNATFHKPLTVAGPVAEQCNQSTQPSICYYSKTVKGANGKTTAFLGRASKQSDWAAWRNWAPPGDLAMEQTSGQLEVAGGVSDVVFYGGIAAALALVAGGVWYYKVRT